MGTLEEKGVSDGVAWRRISACVVRSESQLLL